MFGSLRRGISRARSRERLTPRELLVIFCWCLLAVTTVYLLFRPAGMPSSGNLLSRRFLSPEVAGSRKVSQLLTVDAPGFRGVVLHAVASSQPSSSPVVFELYRLDAAGHEDLLWRTRAPIQKVTANPTFTVTFPPIGERFEQRYRLSVAAPEVIDGEGIRLWAADGRTGPNGMMVGDQLGFSRLVYETRSTRATPWQRLRFAMGEGWPRVLVAALVLSLALLANIAFLEVCAAVVCTR